MTFPIRATNRAILPVLCRDPNLGSHTPGLPERSDASNFQEEPGAGKPPARSCEGQSRMPSYSTRTRFGLDGQNGLWLRESGEMFFKLSAALRGDVQLCPYKFQIWP